MLYKEFTVGNKDYKAILNASAAVLAEEKLGENPLNLLMRMQDDNIPKLGEMLIILHASLQKYQHGISLKDTYDLYDQFIEDGHQLSELLPILVDILEVSGYFKRDEEEVKAGKNSKKEKE